MAFGEDLVLWAIGKRRKRRQSGVSGGTCLGGGHFVAGSGLLEIIQGVVGRGAESKYISYPMPPIRSGLSERKFSVEVIIYVQIVVSIDLVRLGKFPALHLGPYVTIVWPV